MMHGTLTTPSSLNLDADRGHPGGGSRPHNRQRPSTAATAKWLRMKLLLEILLSLILHPIAMILMWINLIVRGDLSTFTKVVWFVVSIIWGLGPILYVLVADGTLW
jgi:hypothetical protein